MGVLVPLGDVATIIAGESPPGTSYNDFGAGLPFFQGKADFSTRYPTIKRWSTEPKKIAEPGDILISIRAPVGPTNIARELCCIGRGLAAIRPDESAVLRDFVHWVLMHLEPKLVEKGKGSTFPAIGKRDLSALEIPLPPLDEQSRIVDILSRSARIQHMQSNVRKTLSDFTPALFIKMFGDPATNPMNWNTRPLGSLGSVNRGRSRHRPRNAPELYGGIYPFVQTGDVSNSNGLISKFLQTYSEIGLAQSRMWPHGTLCITIAANIGMTGILAFDACFPDSVVGFTPGKNVTTEFVQTSLDLMQRNIEERAPQAAQRNINLKVLRELELPVPPYALQRQYTEIVVKTRRLASSSSTASDVSSSLGTSLMTLLLRRTA